MKRGPDLDIEALLTDLGSDPLSPRTDRSDIESDDYHDSWDGDGADEDEYLQDDEYLRDDEYSDR